MLTSYLIYYISTFLDKFTNFQIINIAVGLVYIYSRICELDD